MQRTSALQSILQELDSAIQGLQSEIRAKLEEGQLKEKPMVNVTKAIYDGTTVEGLHSTLVLKESLPDTLIREDKVNHSTPRPKGRGLIEVHPERRLPPRLGRRGFAPSNGSKSLVLKKKKPSSGK
jgi:hypothetical protein